MTCRQLRPYIVDFARGASDALAVEAHITRHLRGCPDCAALLERERILSAALQRATAAVVVPPVTADRERVLLDGFDRLHAAMRPSTRLLVWRWAPAFAVVVAAAAFAGWRMIVPPIAPPARVTPLAARDSVPAPPPRTESVAQPPANVDAAPRERVQPVAARASRRPRRPAAMSDAELAYLEAPFVLWPGAEAAPALESGSVVRARLPAAILPALGLSPPPSSAGDVAVDMLIGQDGFARAVRLVKQ